MQTQPNSSMSSATPHWKEEPASWSSRAAIAWAGTDRTSGSVCAEELQQDFIEPFRGLQVHHVGHARDVHSPSIGYGGLQVIHHFFEIRHVESAEEYESRRIDFGNPIHCRRIQLASQP